MSIIKRQEFQTLKNIQKELNQQFKQNKLNIMLKNIWVNKQNHSISSIIQSIAQGWINEFSGIIENWIQEASSKLIKKLKSLHQTVKNKQKYSNAQETLQNMLSYIKSMQYPVFTSINNIQQLYLKFPAQQFISKNKKFTQIIGNSRIQTVKKKSLSLQSTYSQQNKSRSKSKGRKLSFFANSLKKQSLFDHTGSKQQKRNNTMNTTVKKVKKQIIFSKTQVFSNNTNKINHQKNQTVNKCDQSNLQQKYQHFPHNQRYMNTCQSSFMKNNYILSSQTQKYTSQKQKYQQQTFNNSLKQQILHKINKPKLSMTKSLQQNNSIQEISNKSITEQVDFKKSIIQQINIKQKQNYQQLMGELENKLSNTLESFMEKFMVNRKQEDEKRNKEINKQRQYEEKKKQKERRRIKQEEEIKMLLIKKQKEQQERKMLDRLKQKEEQLRNKQQRIKKMQQQKLKEKQTKLKEQQSKINYTQKQHKVQEQNIKFVDLTNIIQRNSQTRLNSSSIIKKNPDNVIRSSKKRLSNLDQNQPNKIQPKNIQRKISPQTQIYKNKIKTNAQITEQDDIQIIDKFEDKTKIKVQEKIVVEKGQIKQNSNINNNSNGQFLKRKLTGIKQRMQLCFKGYFQICNKLTLPVNQSFLVLFSSIYHQFCYSNNLTIQNTQNSEILKKYNDSKLKSTKLPPNSQNFIDDSLGKMQKMLNLNCPAEKKVKIEQYVKNCIDCIENIYLNKRIPENQQILIKIDNIKKIQAK